MEYKFEKAEVKMKITEWMLRQAGNFEIGLKFETSFILLFPY